MQKADFWIEHLGLARHPEGGYYRENYRSGGFYTFTDNGKLNGKRAWATSIFYLLKNTERSRLHRIHSDELWFYHDGSPLTVHVFPEDNVPSSFTLGLSADKGQVIQETVPAGSWFGALSENPDEESYSLVSCVVAPGFEFGDLVFARRDTMLEKFPLHRKIIEQLT
jgi:uncharacterized protein